LCTLASWIAGSDLDSLADMKGLNDGLAIYA